MRDDQHRFLALFGQPPARLTAEQAAWMLGCNPHDVPILVSARLLKPLGDPMPNSVKYFATVQILEYAKDAKWLAKATTALGRYWHGKNRRKKGPLFEPEKNGLSSPIDEVAPSNFNVSPRPAASG